MIIAFYTDRIQKSPASFKIEITLKNNRYSLTDEIKVGRKTKDKQRGQQLREIRN